MYDSKIYKFCSKPIEEVMVSVPPGLYSTLMQFIQGLQQGSNMMRVM